MRHHKLWPIFNPTRMRVRIRRQHERFEIGPLIFITALFVAVNLLKPDDNRLRFTAKQGPRLFVNDIESVLTTSFFGPCQDRLFVQSVFVVELLDHDGEVLRFVDANRLKRCN